MDKPSRYPLTATRSCTTATSSFGTKKRNKPSSAKFDLCEVLIIDLSGLQKLPADQLIERCVQLGHALGNQHWPAIVQNGFVYVPWR